MILSLKTKTLIVIMATMLVLIVPFYITVRVFLLGKFRKIENDTCQHNIERALNAIFYDLSNLRAISAAFSNISNLRGLDLGDLNINAIVFVSPSGQVAYEKLFDQEASDEFVQLDLFKHIATFSDQTKNTLSGIVLLSERPMLIVSRPVSRAGHIVGNVVLGRFLSAKEITKLAEITPYSIDVSAINDPQVPYSVRQSLLSATNKPTYVVNATSSKSIAGYALINDVYGRPALVLTMSMPRDVFSQGQASLYYFLVSLVLFGLLLFGMVVFLLRKEVLLPIFDLTKNVERITLNNDFSGRVAVIGKDEVSTMGRSVNSMLEALEESQKELRESEERYRHLVELSPDAVIVLRNLEILYINPAGIRLLGGSGSADFGGVSIVSLVPRDFVDKFLGYIESINKGEDASELCYVKLIRCDGAVLDVEIAASTTIYGGKSALQAVVRDVTERNQMESKLKYLSMHDVLTGLYNRAYFEEVIHKLEDKPNSPVSIIVCDVDGLKIINDTFGHAAGDDLLKAAAAIIRQSFRESDAITRIGGDEFAVVLPNCPYDMAQMLCQRLLDNIDQYNRRNPQFPLYISKGIATSAGLTGELHNVFKEADNNMYREKLLHGQSNRSAITKALANALRQGSFIETDKGKQS